MKAILVVDIDDDIRYYGVTVYHYPSRSFVQSMNANLKPLPEPKEPSVDSAKEYWFACGFNDCLEEIEE